MGAQEGSRLRLNKPRPMGKSRRPGPRPAGCQGGRMAVAASPLLGQGRGRRLPVDAEMSSWRRRIVEKDVDWFEPAARVEARRLLLLSRGWGGRGGLSGTRRKRG